MRHLLPFAFFALVITGCETSYRSAPPAEQHVQAVHEVELSKDRIYIAAQSWFAKNLGKSNEALQIQNQQEGLIIGKVVIPGAIKDGLGVSSFDLKLNVKIEAKDKKYRASFEDFTIRTSGMYDGREVTPGSEHQQAKAAAAKLDAEILAAVTGSAAAKDW